VVLTTMPLACIVEEVLLLIFTAKQDQASKAVFVKLRHFGISNINLV
jgi:hypothetical protein